MEFNVGLSSAIYSLSDALDLVGVKELLHGKRVAYMAMEIAAKAGESRSMDDLFVAALLHDCGVSSTRVHEALSSQFDWSGAKEHCDRGYTLLSQCAPLAHLADIVRFHHTYWDELALYDVLDPQLKGLANTLFLADRVDALNDQRAGDDFLVSTNEVREMVKGQRGKMFAPQLVDAFLEISERDGFWQGLEPAPLGDYLAKVVAGSSAERVGYEAFKSVATLFARVVDSKTQYTCGHSLGVSRLARMVGEWMRLAPEELDLLELAGLLHDIGRLRVPDEIMEKPAALDRGESELVGRYSLEGYRILGKVPGLERVALLAGYHHKHPTALARQEEEPPLAVNILNAADVFQAMAQPRPYRERMEGAAIIQSMQEMAERGELDLVVVNVVAEHLEESLELARQKGAATPSAFPL